MGTLGCFAHQVFELGEDLLDRIEIGTVRRQEQEPGASAADRLADGGSFVAASRSSDYALERYS